MMRFSSKNSFLKRCAFALALCAAVTSQAQNNASQAPNGVYIAVDPLAGVRYDNRFDASDWPCLRPHEGWTNAFFRARTSAASI